MTTKATPLVSGVFEQALFTRRRHDFAFTATGLMYHSDAGSQYTLLAFTGALIESGLAGSIGRVGDALDNALMESTIGLYRSELGGRQKSWTGRAEVEREAAAWVHWFNTNRLHSSIGYTSPVDYENDYRQEYRDRRLRPRGGLNQVSIRPRAVQARLALVTAPPLVSEWCREGI